MKKLLVLAVLVGTSVAAAEFKFQGPLSEALTRLAKSKGLNLVVSGVDLDQVVQINLSNMAGDEAIRTLAKVYKLKVEREGNLLIVRSPDDGSRSAIENRRSAIENRRSATESRVDASGGEAGDPSPGKVIVMDARRPVAPVAPRPPSVRSIMVSPDSVRQCGEQECDVTCGSDEICLATCAAVRESGVCSDAWSRPGTAASRTPASIANDLEKYISTNGPGRRGNGESVMHAVANLAPQDPDDGDAAAADSNSGPDDGDDTGAGGVVGGDQSTTGPLVIARGSVVQDAVAFAGSVTIEEGAVVRGDAVAVGGNVELKSGAVVRGDAVAIGGVVNRGPGAVVRGEVVSMGWRGLASMAPGGVFTGYHHQDSNSAARDGKRNFAIRVAAFFAEFAVLFGTGFVLLMFLPDRMRRVSDALREGTARNFFVGLGSLFAGITLMALLTVTLIGIPVAMVVAAAIAAAAIVGPIAVAYEFGGTIPFFRRMHLSKAGVLALGILALLALGHVPVLGPALLAAVAFIGMGAIVRSRFGQAPRGTPMVDNDAVSASL